MSRILAIEPDADRAVLLQQLVQESLHTNLVLASSSDAAIAAIADARPDLILTSMLLAAGEEQELVAHLRSTPSLRHIPVLTIPAVTGHTAADARPTGLFARFWRRQAPVWPTYNFNAVIQRIEEALEQSRVAAQADEIESKELESFEPMPSPVGVHIDLQMAADPEPVAEPLDLLVESGLVASGSRPRARRLPGADVPWLSTVKLSWGQSLRLLNISSSGMLVESGVRLTPGSETKIQLDGPGLDLAVPARVTRCRVSEVDSLGVRYETAAMFERPIEELLPAEQEPGNPVDQLDELVETIEAFAARGTSQAQLRATFESGVLDLITARDVRLRDVPVAENDGRESIYFTVPAADGARAVLQVTFNANDAPALDDFTMLNAAARAAARLLPLTGTARQAALELQVA